MVGRDGFGSDDQATATLSRPLRLRTGVILPSVRVVDLSPGPSFIWRRLTVGATILLVGAIGLAATQLHGASRVRGVLALHLLLVVVLLLGAATLVRSFRTA